MFIYIYINTGFINWSGGTQILGIILDAQTAGNNIFEYPQIFEKIPSPKIGKCLAKKNRAFHIHSKMSR